MDRYSPGQTGLRVQLIRALAVGPVARLELEREDNGEMIEVEIPIELYRKLKLTEGEALVVKPKRMQVFLKPDAAQAAAAGPTPT
jgi:sulfate transport system ATP-binding protein